MGTMATVTRKAERGPLPRSPTLNISVTQLQSCYAILSDTHRIPYLNARQRARVILPIIKKGHTEGTRTRHLARSTHTTDRRCGTPYRRFTETRLGYGTEGVSGRPKTR